MSSSQNLQCTDVAIKYGGVAALNGVSLAIELGIVLVPEDRIRQGVIVGLAGAPNFRKQSP